MVKCAAIRSETLLRYLERRLPEIQSCQPHALEYVIIESCRIKAEVVSRDEREGKHRMILNYGHTVGHALEAATHYRKFTHGEAVAWGMLAALQFGNELGMLDSGPGRPAGAADSAGRGTSGVVGHFVRGALAVAQPRQEIWFGADSNDSAFAAWFLRESATISIGHNSRSFSRTSWQTIG